MSRNTENIRATQGSLGPGLDTLETMSVTAYSKKAKAVSEEVKNVLEAGWTAAVEKRARGKQIQELLTMASVVRYQIKAISHGGMSLTLKEKIKPPALDERLMASTAPATEYIKTTLIESKEQIVAMHNENRTLKRTLKQIQSQMRQMPDESVVGEVKVTSFWDNEEEMGKILGELDLEEELDF